MALRQTKKISELTALTSASLQTTLLGVDNGTTYKVTLDVLEDAIISMVSRSTDLRLDSLEAYTASANVATDIILLNSFTSSQESLNTAFTNGISARLQTSSFNQYTASISTASLVNRLNAIESVSGSWITESETGSFLTSLSGAISSSAQITTFGFVSGSYETTGRGIISSSANLVTTSSFNSYTASISTASLVTSISNLNSATSSYLTSLSGAISSSSQLTSSYDSRYTLSGSVSAVPSGTISGSAQITAFGFVSSSTSVPAGTISGSSQLTSSFDGRYTQTGSFNTLTASFNSFTASAQSVTTGSNSFNGTQTITGSLIITTGSFIGSQITANTASLYLTSGSNLYVQNNGVVEITGSLNVSSATTLKGSVNIGTGSGFEGGEIDLAYAQAGSTTLTGSAVVFDVYQDRVRIFENGGTNRGGYFDISTLTAGVGTDLGKLTYFIEAYANVSYTLPGGYSNDVCRYSVVSANLNVPTSWFNTSTYTFTPLRAGYWEIIASYDVYRNGEASLIIQKNGTSVAQAGSISSVVQQITKIIYMNGSTDYINVYNSGVNANARTQASSNAFFQAKYIGS